MTNNKDAVEVLLYSSIKSTLLWDSDEIEQLKDEQVRCGAVSAPGGRGTPYIRMIGMIAVF